MNKNTISAVLVLIAIVVGAYFLVHKKTEAPATSPSPASSTNTNTNTNMPKMVMTPTPIPAGYNAAISLGTGSAIQKFTVTGQNFSFSPNVINVKKGDIVRINFKNAAGFHDFRIDEFKVTTPQMKAGEEGAVLFVADKVGSFQFYCSVGSHRSMGMWGTLNVQ